MVGDVLAAHLVHGHLSADGIAALLDVGVVLAGAGGVVGLGDADGRARAAEAEAVHIVLDDGRAVGLAGAGAAGAVIALRHVDGALGRAIVGAGGDGGGRALDAPRERRRWGKEGVR